MVKVSLPSSAQGLYVFDCIIVLYDKRSTMTDVAIVSNCARFNIPAFIVWSKADQHTRNIMKGMGRDSDDDESNPGSYDRFTDWYISFPTTLVSTVKGKAPRKANDEIELLKDIINQTLGR